MPNKHKQNLLFVVVVFVFDDDHLEGIDHVEDTSMMNNGRIHHRTGNTQLHDFGCCFDDHGKDKYKFHHENIEDENENDKNDGNELVMYIEMICFVVVDDQDEHKD